MLIVPKGHLSCRGNGTFFAEATGPGKVWLGQARAGQCGAGERGSVLGSLGGILDGDNSV